MRVVIYDIFTINLQRIIPDNKMFAFSLSHTILYYKDIFLKEILGKCPFCVMVKNLKLEENKMLNTTLKAEKKNVGKIWIR